MTWYKPILRTAYYHTLTCLFRARYIQEMHVVIKVSQCLLFRNETSVFWVSCTSSWARSPGAGVRGTNHFASFLENSWLSWGSWWQTDSRRLIGRVPTILYEYLGRSSVEMLDYSHFVGHHQFHGAVRDRRRNMNTARRTRRILAGYQPFGDNSRCRSRKEISMMPHHCVQDMVPSRCFR